MIKRLSHAGEFPRQKRHILVQIAGVAGRRCYIERTWLDACTRASQQHPRSVLARSRTWTRTTSPFFSRYARACFDYASKRSRFIYEARFRDVIELPNYTDCPENLIPVKISTLWSALIIVITDCC